VIEAVRSLKPAGDFPGFYEVDDRSVASDVADTLANDCVQSTPVIVIAQTGTLCNISARCPDGIDVDIGAIIRETAHECGGYGGGHRRRAGATISCSEIENFRSGLQEVMAS
jgi:single-stranded-DNA-specific exonuclease